MTIIKIVEQGDTAGLGLRTMLSGAEDNRTNTIL